VPPTPESKKPMGLEFLIGTKIKTALQGSAVL